MTEIDLSGVLNPRAVRRLLIGGASLAAAAGAAVVLAGPALANEGSTPDAAPSPLAACASSLPLTTPCSVDVSAAVGTAGTFVVTLPGIGTLNITVDATNKLTAASVINLTGFSASTPLIDGDGDKVAVTLTSTTDPNQVYILKVAVKPPATPGGAPTITAKVKAGETENEDKNEQNEQQGEHDGGSSGETLSDHGGHHEGGGDH